MTIRESYVCPHCGSERVQIFGVQRLFEDGRYDMLGCSECRTEWRVYYKVSDISVETRYVPAARTNDLPTDPAPCADEDVSSTDLPVSDCTTEDTVVDN